MLEWADAEDTVETLRRKTAEHFHGKSDFLCLQKRIFGKLCRLFFIFMS